MLEELNFTPTTFTDEVAREQSHMLCAQQCRRRGRTYLLKSTLTSPEKSTSTLASRRKVTDVDFVLEAEPDGAVGADFSGEVDVAFGLEA